MKILNEVFITAMLALILGFSFGCGDDGNSGSGNDVDITNNNENIEEEVNNAPTAYEQSLMVLHKNNSVEIALKASDPEDDELSWSLKSKPTFGEIDWSGVPDIKYTPDKYFIGKDSFSFSVSDGKNISNNATINITVKNVWFVNKYAPSGGDGLGWATAFQHPKHVNGKTETGDEVWVAKGEYTGQGITALKLEEAVSYYGGFRGTETNLEERDHDLNETILNGNNSVFHVVTGATSARIDGFTITGGYANGDSDEDKCGGGILNHELSFTAANCFINNNRAQNDGGGIYNDQESTLKLVNCLFENNSTISTESNVGYGGAVCCKMAKQIDITGCIFKGNEAQNEGGGVWSGAMGLNATSTKIVNSAFYDNTSQNNGGGLFVAFTSTMILENTVFINNRSSAKKGGGIYLLATSIMTKNCTFTDNSAVNGGGIATYYCNLINITNCILWHNNPDEIWIYHSGSPPNPPTIAFSNVEGGYDGEGNIDADPLFINAAEADLHLQAGSPCIDAAKGDVPPDFDSSELDKEGNARYDDPDSDNTGIGNPGYVDMGAYEYIGE